MKKIKTILLDVLTALVYCYGQNEGKRIFKELLKYILFKAES